MSADDLDARVVDFLEKHPAANEVGPFRRLNVAKMLRTTPPPVPWLVEPVLARGVLSMLFGREGKGKSLVALALGIAVASGDEVAGLSATAGKVLYIDAENGPREIHRRFRSLGMPESAADNLAVYETSGADLRRDLDHLEEVVREEEPAFLILDSYRSLWGGDENDSREAGPLLDRIRSLLRDLDCASLLLHHSGKAGSEYRGSSSIGAAAEIIYRLADAEGDEDAERREFSCTKMRLAPEPPTRYLRLRAELGLALLEEAVPPEVSTDQGGRPATAREELAPRIEELLAGSAEPMSLADVARAVDRDPKNGTVRRLLQGLADEGRAVKCEVGWEGVPKPPDRVGGRQSFGTPGENSPLQGKNGAKTVVRQPLGGTPSGTDLERWETMAEGGAA